MSYDLHVYASEGLDRHRMEEILSSCGLAVDVTQGGLDELTVVRGARRSYSFTTGIADRLEPEDIPDEVTAVLLDPRFLYEILIEGSSVTEVPHATRFARKLAHAARGVVVDEQAGTVWSRGKLRTPPKVERGLIDLVEVYWWVTSRTDPTQAAGAWIESAHRHFPEALPRRWGLYEPLTERTDPSNADGFVRFISAADGMVFFKSSNPAIDGHAATPGGRTDIDSYSLSLHRAALHERAWRESLQRFFVEFASAISAVLATAEVVRNIEWSGRSVGFTAESERPAYLAVREGWAGLPPYPTWWSWFGPEYVPLVEANLDPHFVSGVGDGLFHWRSVEPADREQLNGPRPVRKLRKRVSNAVFRRPAQSADSSWLPAELLAVQPTPDPGRGWGAPLELAAVRPPALAGQMP